MWRAFDLVGVTERFDEFLLTLAELVGLQPELLATGCRWWQRTLLPGAGRLH